MFSQGTPADGTITGHVGAEPSLAANSIWQGLPAVQPARSTPTTTR